MTVFLTNMATTTKIRRGQYKQNVISNDEIFVAGYPRVSPP